MIIYFSGTGNSAMVARELRNRLFGEDKDSPEARMYELSADRLQFPHRQLLKAADGERVIWVFPVYAWAPPYMVIRFIRKVKFLNGENARHFMVCTCGDDIGRADDRWREAVGRRQWRPLGAFSVQMPNTYVCMKGFDTDPAEVADGKLAAMPARVAEIAGAICRNFGGSDVVRGGWPWTKSNIIYPWFRAFKMNPSAFNVDAQKCVTCGLCARECPMLNITMRDGLPRWGPACTMCLRCYHSCPSSAIACGRATLGKGHYRAPL